MTYKGDLKSKNEGWGLPKGGTLKQILITVYEHLKSKPGDIKPNKNIKKDFGWYQNEGVHGDGVSYHMHQYACWD